MLRPNVRIASRPTPSENRSERGEPLTPRKYCGAAGAEKNDAHLCNCLDSAHLAPTPRLAAVCPTIVRRTRVGRIANLGCDANLIGGSGALCNYL
jgi:hypothetical protein